MDFNTFSRSADEKGMQEYLNSKDTGHWSSKEGSNKAAIAYISGIVALFLIALAVVILTAIANYDLVIRFFMEYIK